MGRAEAHSPDVLPAPLLVGPASWRVADNACPGDRPGGLQAHRESLPRLCAAPPCTRPLGLGPLPSVGGGRGRRAPSALAPRLAVRLGEGRPAALAFPGGPPRIVVCAILVSRGDGALSYEVELEPHRLPASPLLQVQDLMGSPKTILS